MRARVACDNCGKFISYAALADGSARHAMVTPDANRCAETFETLCAKCRTTTPTSDFTMPRAALGVAAYASSGRTAIRAPRGRVSRRAHRRPNTRTWR